MSDLISRDALNEALSDWNLMIVLSAEEAQKTGEWRVVMPRVEVLRRLMNAPAVDAVEVVRCKDCANSCHNGREGTRTCRKFRRVVGVNSYCSCGIAAEELEGTECD